MDPVIATALVVAFVVVAAIGGGVGLYVARTRQDTAENTVAQLAAALKAEQDARVAGVVESVVNVAGESFDSRLKTGTAELEARREAIDNHLDGTQKKIEERLSAVVTSMTEKVEAVDKLVGERVGGMSKNLGQQVTTMNAELSKVRGLVAELQKEKAKQHGEFVASLEGVTQQQKALGETTSQLREALSSAQKRGQWGERMAEDVLRMAGMREFVNYRKQQQIEGGTRPDFTFLLPDDIWLHMDVKFPFDNYLKFLDASTEAEAGAYRKSFLGDVREQVKGLLKRGYTDPETTVGYLLLFIPNESVFGFINENDDQLLDYALENKVVLCSPTTLFAVLCVIRQAMDTFSLARDSSEILECLVRVKKQWEMFADQIDKVDRNISTLSSNFGILAGSRRRLLEKQLDRIDEIRQPDALGDRALDDR